MNGTAAIRKVHRAVVGAALLVVVMLLCFTGCDDGTGSSRSTAPAGVTSQDDAAQPAEPTAELAATLPADGEKVARALTYHLEAGQFSELMLSVNQISQPIDVTIPAGTRAAAPVDQPNPEHTLMVLEDTTLQLRKPGNYVIRVALTDPAGWGTDTQGRRYRFEPGEMPPKLKAFVVEARRRKMIDSSIQIGVWVALRDVGLNDLSDKTLVYQSGMAAFMSGTPGMLVTISSYRTIRAVEDTMAAAGYDPAAFRLFKENHADFDDKYARLAPEDWQQQEHTSPNVLSMVERYRYEGESKVDDALLDHLRSNRDYHFRLAVIRQFEEMKGILDADIDPYAAARREPDRLARLAYIRTMAFRGDERYVPLQLAYERDASLFQITQPHWLAEQIERDTGKRWDRDGETMFAYWQRTGGWERLPQQADIAELKVFVDDIRKQEQQAVDEAVAYTLAPEREKPLDALATLRLRYAAEPAAFEALKKLMVHDDPNVRQGAVYGSLSEFKKHHSLPYDLLIARAKVEPEGVVVDVLLREQITGDDPDKHAQIIKAALANASDKAREVAARAAQPAEIATRMQVELAAMLRNDPSLGVRAEAANALLNVDSPEAVEQAASVFYISHDDEKAFGALVQRVAGRLASIKDRNLAWQQLSKAAAEAPTPIARTHAIRQLASFFPEQRSDVFLLKRFPNEAENDVQLALLHEAREVRNAVRNARGSEKQQIDLISSDVTTQADALYALALVSAHEDVRKKALDFISYEDVAPQLDHIEKAARNDASRDIASKAFYIVHKVDAEKARAVLVDWLGRDDRRADALSILERSYRDDAQAVTMLKPYENDAKLGRRVKTFIERAAEK